MRRVATEALGREGNVPAGRSSVTNSITKVIARGGSLDYCRSHYRSEVPDGGGRPAEETSLPSYVHIRERKPAGSLMDPSHICLYHGSHKFVDRSR